ncbi:MAG: hypothetical protein BA872_06110 [Desulfobacterales bacterium C00003060]|nr:MAG: hypothetical protein BA861_09340 [Desulfobacterales bacterium S3730MH5]OEU77398.1 MAG: hypothetical protein BA872_06110 [Desulfobacterales bacterium C00003060]OEU81179.1 MAG: hypothetical protein BA865_01505 [Desulfobacterales bacterium S5133MH4]
MCRHAGLDPASSFIMLLELFWIPVPALDSDPGFAGMTIGCNCPSFPRMRESRKIKRLWIPAFAGMTEL